MSDEQKHFDNIFFFGTNHFETRTICSIINKLYSNKRMAKNNKWKILTPLKFFYTSNYSLGWPQSQVETALSNQAVLVLSNQYNTSTVG